ncbi:ribonuclease P 40kDa subunit-domain-containing protein [Schizophyllum amplum]|uniref:Ribonuclease P 40kDa subunit-domain-containing protein n=1 Tax=Schizophyllum amplum TaxID=97359 RepID=A0A550BZC1_9AGAR|nr:ribonuclease P 40kDa subunit-domain-containing protein [Auriculariopsis ampla]
MSPTLERRRLKISAGTVPTHLPRLKTLAESHNFSEQVDIVFPSSASLADAFSKLETRYAKGKARLSDIYVGSASFIDTTSSSMLWLGTSGGASDDTWCIDANGQLVICVSEGMYQKLGLGGKKLKYKAIHSDMYVVSIPLQKAVHSPSGLARIKEGLRILDACREMEGLGEWDIVCTALDPTLLPTFLGKMLLQAETRTVTAEMTEVEGVHVPQVQLGPFPSRETNMEDKEDWHYRMSNLFEWVGMAALASQRLSASDRIDPYIAIYAPPEPSQVGNVTHLRWRGLLSPTFLQSLIDTITEEWLAANNSVGFVAMTVQSCVESPVCYVRASTDVLHKQPMRQPREDGEDTWSVLFSHLQGQDRECEWALVESLGQGDGRWG